MTTNTIVIRKKFPVSMPSCVICAIEAPSEKHLRLHIQSCVRCSATSSARDGAASAAHLQPLPLHLQHRQWAFNSPWRCLATSHTTLLPLTQCHRHISQFFGETHVLNSQSGNECCENKWRSHRSFPIKCHHGKRRLELQSLWFCGSKTIQSGEAYEYTNQQRSN